MFEFVATCRRSAVETVSLMEKASPNCKISPYAPFFPSFYVFTHNDKFIQLLFVFPKTLLLNSSILIHRCTALPSNVHQSLCEWIRVQSLQRFFFLFVPLSSNVCFRWKEGAGCAFKVMEALRDPEDFHELVRVMGDDRSKATVSRMKSECCRILRSRWWKWVLEHPLLGPDDIHQSKSVPPSPFWSSQNQ